MTECQGVSPRYRLMFTALSFKDENCNGVIERNGEEGYKENADFNNDGKIVKAEVRAFYDKAMRTDIDLMLMVTSNLSKANLHAESLAAARKIKSPDYRASTISCIAVDMAKAGADKHQIISTFREAMRNIRLAELNERKGLQEHISSNIAEAGLGKSEEAKLLAEVKKSLPPRTPSDLDIETALDHASYWASDENRQEALDNFRTALVLTLRKEGYLTPRDVAARMVKAKMTPAEIKSLFREYGRKVPDLQ
jgi:hypothetical protein